MSSAIVHGTAVYVGFGIFATIAALFVPAAKSDPGCVSLDFATARTAKQAPAQPWLPRARARPACWAAPVDGAGQPWPPWHAAVRAHTPSSVGSPSAKWLVSLTTPPLLVRLARLLIWLAVVCCWLLWVITYMMQLNPLITPVPLAAE